MTKNILITGGNGLIGRFLTTFLESKGFSVAHLSRSTSSTQKTFLWDYKKEYIDKEALFWADTIVHLAGSSVAGGYWTKKTKKEIYESRILGTRFLKNTIEQSGIRIDYFVSASATGIYNQYVTGVLGEDGMKGNDFLANVVQDWEKEIFADIDIPTAALRIGVVLSKDGGALPKLMQPIKLGLGANLGNGKQYMPWIHIHDLCAAFGFAIENKMEGVFNAVAPEHVQHQDFNKQLALQLNKKMWLPNVPAFLLKIALGEMSAIVLKGCPISSQKIQNSGFKFLYSSLHDALEDLIPIP